MILKTVNNIKNQQAFMSHSQKTAAIVVIVISMLSIILGILGITKVFDMDGAEICFLFFGVFYLLFYFWLMVYIRAFALKKNPTIGENIINTFSISNNNFSVETKKDDKVISTTNFEIDTFKKAVETKEHVFVWISRQYAYIIAKGENTEVDIEDLKNILTEKLGARFKKQKELENKI